MLPKGLPLLQLFMASYEKKKKRKKKGKKTRMKILIESKSDSKSSPFEPYFVDDSSHYDSYSKSTQGCLQLYYHYHKKRSKGWLGKLHWIHTIDMLEPYFQYTIL